MGLIRLVLTIGEKTMNASSDPSPGGCEVSIVIVNWNTRELLGNCISSIIRETTKSYEIIVIDNASTDGTATMVATEFPEVVLIANTENRGFAAANNQGFLVATGHKILLLNPDTLILDGAVDRMVDWLDEYPDVGCVGCQVMKDEETIQLTCFADLGPLNLALVEFGIQRLMPRHPLIGRPEYGGWDRLSQRDVDVVTGMFMLVPRRVIDQVGGLDEAFFIYAEEADWCRRIRDAGWRCVFTPTARILHLDGGGKSTKSTLQMRTRMYVQLYKSKMIYLRKHHGRTGAIVGWVILSLSALLKFGSNLPRRNSESAVRRQLAFAALRYHLFRKE